MIIESSFLSHRLRYSHSTNGCLWWYYRRCVSRFFYTISFTIFNCHSSLGFFAGKRFVPIVTAFSAVLLGIVMFMVWPFAQTGLNALSHFMLETNRTLAAFVFGLVERSLIPFGLHHIFYSPFWFEFGTYTNAAGEFFRGDQRISLHNFKMAQSSLLVPL